MKQFIKFFTRSPKILALFLNFARPPLNEPGREGKGRDWVEAGSDVIQSTQTQINTATSVRSATYEKIKLKSVDVNIL